MTAPLKYLSEDKLQELREKVDAHLDRYGVGNFSDLEHDNGWAVESSLVEIDSDLLGQLDATAGDVTNSLVVHKALIGMTPALAAEERVWVRLTHIECLHYTRTRWLEGKETVNLTKAVLTHAFANGRTGIRDDNALSRLWWNVHIASIADPDDPAGALTLIAKTADIRQAFVERPGTAARPPLARAIVRAMRREKWLTAAEENFREFMKVLNRDGGGVLFEALADNVADDLMDRCIERARENLDAMVHA